MHTINQYRQALKNRIVRYYMLTNYYMLYKSRKTKRHIVVFESDDWGSIRIPSKDILERIKLKTSNGILTCSFDKFDEVDTLASNSDLENLIEVLNSVRDMNGNPAKITLNCVMANPDFEKIRKSNFTEYHYELFTETLKRYPNHDRAFSLWQEGIKNNLFMPQFHGREHLNFQKWLFFLSQNNKDVRECFNENFFSMRFSYNNCTVRCLDAYDFKYLEDNKVACQAVSEGLDIFEKIFGFKSISMIAPCFVWNDDIENVAFEKGVKYIQGALYQKYPEYMKKTGKSRYLGEENSNGQIYLVRNCLFEPSQMKNSINSADKCLAQIDRMFRWNLPAIVSCHRLNFIGGLSEKNRDVNLREFKYMINVLTKKYPDIEFYSSNELFLHM